MGYAYGISSRANEARQVIDELTGFSQQGYAVQGEIALVYKGLGDQERIWNYLGKVVESQAPFMLFLKVDPLWQNLRSEPRFLALLKKMGLEK